MGLCVDIKIAPLCVFLLTQRALVRPFASVTSDVRSQRVLDCETIAAERTNIWSFARMRSRVNDQGTSVDEAFVTHGAGVWPIRQVTLHVSFQGAFAADHFMANRALKHFRVDVHHLDVSPHTSLGWKTFVAQGAFERLFASVPSDVHL